MAFNLGNFLKGAVAQVNPFDGGQTYASVQRQAAQQAPPPARTASPSLVQQIVRSPVAQDIAKAGDAIGQWGIHSAPILSNAFQFAQSNHGNPTLPQFVGGIAGTGYVNSPLGSAERTLARTAATITQHPVHIPGVSTQLPVNQEVAQAPGLWNKALTTAGIVGDVLGTHEPAVAGIKGAVKGAELGAAANDAFNAHLDSLAPGVAQGGYTRDLGSGQFSRTAVHPEDASTMAAFIDHARGVTKLPDAQAHQLELDAARIAEHYNIGGKATTPTKLANSFDRVLSASPESLRPAISQGGYLGLPPSDGLPTDPGNPDSSVSQPQSELGPRGKLTRYASKTVPESDLVSSPVREQVKQEAPSYTVQTEQGRLQSATKMINEKGPDAAIADIQQRLNVPNGKISSQDVTDAHAVAAGLDARGDAHSLQQAADIYKKLSEHLTASGQTVQAAAMIARRSPQGLKYQAISDLNKAGVEVTPELAAKIDGHIKSIRDAGDDPEAKGKAVAGLSKTVKNAIPQSAAKNLVSVWKAGLLSGTKTQGGNLISNATFAGLKSISDLPATATDKIISVGTGVRTKTLTDKGVISGTKEGFKNAGYTMKTGIDLRSVRDKYEQHAEINFKNPVVQKVLGDPANFIFRGMNAADQPFWYSAFKNSMYDQAKAGGLTKKLSGKELAQHMDNLVANPTDSMVQTATQEADKATLGYDTLPYKAIQGAHMAIDNAKSFSEAEKTTAHTVINVLAPFTKVPTAFLSRTIDFTPLGPVKEVMTQIARKRFDQRALSQAIGEGVTGTGVIAIGMQLAHNNLLSGDYPKNDPKEAARWKAEGIIPNAVKLGNKWVSLNYLGPIGLLFNAGNQMVEAANNGAGSPGQAAKAIGGLGQGLLGQSFLQGFSGFSDAIQDPARNLTKFVNSQAGSLVPNIINDAANISDSLQRQVNGPLDAIKSRVPGLRQGLAPKIDAFGNDLSQPSGSGLNTAFNPLKPSNSIDNPMLSELNRLGQTGNLAFPTPSKTIGSGKDAVKLNPDQQTQRQKYLGQILTPLWSSIISSPGYQQLDDAHKHDVLQSALTDVNGATDRHMLSQIDPSKLSQAAKGNVARILSGNIPTAAEYLAKAAGKGTTPTSKYQQTLAQYTADKAAGKLSPVQDFKAQQSLGRQAITSKYSQDVLDFYSMSKAEESAYFQRDPTTAKQLYAQAQQLDSELVGSKYKYGLGTKPKKAKAGSTIGTKKASLNYTKLVSVGSKSTNFSAVRNLVKGSKITAKGMKAPRSAKVALKTSKVSKKRTQVA